MEVFWRPAHPFAPNEAGQSLGIALQEQFPIALERARQRTAELRKDYLRHQPEPHLSEAVMDTLNTRAARPLLMTTPEFLQLCKGVTRAIPECKANGLPADLWFQLLTFCHLDVLPQTVYEDMDSFPMPDNLAEPGGLVRKQGSCVYLHAQGYYYEKMQHRMRSLCASIIAHDARRFSSAAKEVVALADAAVPQVREVLRPSLHSLDVVHIVLDYWLHGGGTWRLE